MDAETLMRAVEARRREAQAVYYAEPLPNEPPAVEVLAEREAERAARVLEAREMERGRAEDRAAVMAARVAVAADRAAILPEDRAAILADDRRAMTEAAEELRETRGGFRETYSDADLVAALDGAHTVGEAAAVVGCRWAVVPYRAGRSVSVLEALERVHDRKAARSARRLAERNAATKAKRRAAAAAKDAEMVAALDAALSVTAAAAALGCSPETIRTRSERRVAVGEARERLRGRSGAARTDAEMVAALDAAATITAAVAAVGCSRETIRTRSKRRVAVGEALERLRDRQKGGARFRWQTADLVAAVDGAVTVRDAAAALGCAPAIIFDRRARSAPLREALGRMGVRREDRSKRRKAARRERDQIRQREQRAEARKRA